MKCNYCGKRNKKDTQICDKCGKEVDKELTNLEEIEKYVRSIGVSISAFGWFTVIGNTLIYFVQFLDEEFLDFNPDLSALFLGLVIGFLFVILGNRIKNVYDKKIKTYLTILVVIQIIFSILAWSTGGIVGLVALIYIISSFFKYNSFLKEEQYKEALVEKEYKIKKAGWVLIIISIFLLGWLTLSYDLNNLYTDISTSDIQEVVEYIKYSYDLPHEIDEVTVWTDVTAEEGAIRYHYELSNLGDRPVSESLLRDFIGDGICADMDVSNSLKGGINMEYSYTVKETGEEFLVVFTEEDCF